MGHFTKSRQRGRELEVRGGIISIGIEPSALDKIFQPVYTAKKRRGLGLGLPICERIVKNHGGEIKVQSQPGQGATFYLEIPK